MAASVRDRQLRLGLRFLISAIVIYTLLVIPWPGLAEGYAACYRAVAETVFGSFGPGGTVRFRANPVAGSPMDSQIVFRNNRSPVSGTTAHHARLTGYLPTAEMLALLLATPLPWSRRFRALLWGMPAINVFVGLRVAITVLHWFCGDYPWALYHPGPFWNSVQSSLFEMAVMAPTGSFIVPIFLWILIVFRRDEWRSLFRAMEKAPA